MKNKYFLFAILLLIAGALLTGCEKTSENAKEKVSQANRDMADVQAQFDKDWEQFKNDAELKINANQKNIDDFKIAMKKTSKKFRAKYENQVLTLEQKNIELKKDLNAYKYEGKDNWEQFKQKLNNNIDSVGNALKGIFEKKN